jgi:phage terminase large subunit GpA-like protein
MASFYMQIYHERMITMIKEGKFDARCPRCGESITFKVEATTDGDGGAALEANSTVCKRCNFEVRLRGIEAHLVIDDARVYTPPKYNNSISKRKAGVF